MRTASLIMLSGLFVLVLMLTKSVTLLFQTPCWALGPTGSDGINYAVHSLCTSASLPEKTQTKDIIVRPLGPDRAAMGRSFDDLSAGPHLAIVMDNADSSELLRRT